MATKKKPTGKASHAAPAKPGPALRRLYLDIPIPISEELDKLAKAAGQSKRVYFARLLIAHVERERKFV